MIGKKKIKSNKELYVGRPIMIVTEQGYEWRQVSKWELGDIQDSEGVNYRKTMLFSVVPTDGGKPFFLARPTMEALQTLEELSADMAVMILSNIMKVKSSAVTIAQWAIMGALLIAVLVLASQVSGFKNQWLSDIAMLTNAVERLTAQMAAQDVVIK